MSVSLLEVIEAAGYNLSTLEDANWLISQVQQFEELVEAAENFFEEESNRELAESEAEYNRTFGGTE